MSANLVYEQERTIANDDELIQIISGNPDIGKSFRVTGEFTHTYTPNGEDENSYDVKYLANQLVFWDGTEMRPFMISYDTLYNLFDSYMDDPKVNLMYKRFQTWALHWFQSEIQDAAIFFESFFGRGVNNIAANSVKSDEMFMLTKDDGNLNMSSSGTVSLVSKYSQFKVNLEVNFPNCQSNSNYIKFTVNARTVKNNQAGTVVNITQVATLDTSIPTHHITFNYDLYDKKSVQFRFSTDEGVATAWNFSSNISVLGYIIGKSEGN